MNLFNNPLTILFFVVGVSLQLGSIAYLVLAGDAQMAIFVTLLVLGALIESGGLLLGVLKARS